MKLKYIKILLIVLTIILVTIIYKFIIPQLSQFGNIIGTFDGVDVYSNQRGETDSSSPNYYNGIYTGIKWQCVEFVRRYLIITRGITFSNVDSAFEIPSAQFKTINGVLIEMSNELKVGSLIVWPKDYKKTLKHNFPFGHVAIVKFITPFGILVVEQNYMNDQFCRFIRTNELQQVTILCPLE